MYFFQFFSSFRVAHLWQCSVNWAGIQLKTKLYCCLFSFFFSFLPGLFFIHCRSLMWLEMSVSRSCHGWEDEAVELSSRSQGGMMLSSLRAVAEGWTTACSYVCEAGVTAHGNFKPVKLRFCQQRSCCTINSIKACKTCLRRCAAWIMGAVCLCCSLGTWASLGTL